jgi:bacteriocin-like protein
MNTLTDTEMAQVNGGEGAIATFGAQLASDGFRHAESSNYAIAALGVLTAAAGGWTWAFGSFCDGVTDLYNYAKA